MSDQPRLVLVPIRQRHARAFVAEHHRHNAPSRGAVFCLAVATDDEHGRLVGVAMVGRPVAREYDDGWTLEVNRTATDGTPNANSHLYGAAWRAARALGWRRLITYTQGDEPGTSLRAAGWRIIGERKARPGWADSTKDPRLHANARQRGRRRRAAHTLGGTRMTDVPEAVAHMLALREFEAATSHWPGRWAANFPVEAVHAEQDALIYEGDASHWLPRLPAGSAQTIVTSPPYYKLRDYGHPDQLGLEPTPAAYVEALVARLELARRVLADDGTLWLNLGDTYSGRANGGPSFDRHRGRGHRPDVVAAPANTISTVPYKSLLGIPWRVAFALIDAGWVLRNEVVWHKPNAMPESVRDRLSNRHEKLFLFTKRPKGYRFDLDAIKVPTTGLMPGNTAEDRTAYGEASGVGRDRRFGGNPRSTLLEPHADRNPGDVWTITTKPYKGAHFAVMPYDMARTCILAGAPDEGAVVLDPFAGACTTLLAARQLGRRGVGIELNPEFVPLGVDRLGHPTLVFE